MEVCEVGVGEDLTFFFSLVSSLFFLLEQELCLNPWWVELLSGL